MLLALLCLLLLVGQGIRLSHAAVDLPNATAVSMHCADAGACHAPVLPDCCDDQLQSCALECAQGTAWLPAMTTQLHLSHTRALPPPVHLRLPDPLMELPYQPPRTGESV